MTEIPIEINIMHEERIVLGNCLNNLFTFINDNSFNDVDDHFL